VGIVALIISLTTCGVVVQAQQPAKISRIGFLSVTSPSTITARMEAFRQGLRALGYVEGKNIILEYRYAEGKLDRVKDLALQLTALKVDIIVSAGSAATRPAKEATSTIPIVMTQDTDPVGNGFVASLARPGGNITGLSILAPDLSGKQLELLKETIPRLSHVVFLANSNEPGYTQLRKEAELAAKTLNLQIQFLDTRDPKMLKLPFVRQTRRMLTP